MKGIKKINAIDELSIFLTMDNYYDGLLLPEKNVQRFGYFWPGISLSPLPVVTAEYGFASYIEVATMGEKSAILFDFGLSKRGVSQNMAAMGVDLSRVKAVVLSHGHPDHYGGLKKVMEGFSRKLPFYVGKDAFLRRIFCLPNMNVDLGKLNPDEIRPQAAK